MPLTINGAAGTIGGLAAGGLSNNTIVAANIADNTIEREKISSSHRGPDVKNIHFQSIRYDFSGPTSNDVTLIQFPVTRKSTSNHIVFWGWMPFQGNDSNRVGENVIMNYVRKYKSARYRNSNEGGTDGIYSIINFCGYFSASDLSTAATSEFIVNYAPRDGSSQTLGAAINPSRNSQSDRSQNKTTKIHFFEFDNLTIIT